jgi:hypothetical protein
MANAAEKQQSLVVLNADILKRRDGVSGMRFWHTVAAAADSRRGKGHVALVVADKNLVPFPRGNLERAAEILAPSGAEHGEEDLGTDGRC